MDNEARENRRYSSEVARILERKPSFLVRWGIPLVGCVFILCLAGTHFIPYATTLDYDIQQIRILPGNGSPAGPEITFPVPSSDPAMIREGIQVRLIIQPAIGDSQLRLNGIVTSVECPEGRCLVRVRVPATAETRVLPSSPDRMKVQFILGHTTVLRQIFNPMISLVRGGQINHQTEGKP